MACACSTSSAATQFDAATTHADAQSALGVLAALVPAWAETAPEHIEYLPGGYTNRNYRVEIDGGAFALRIVKGRTPHPAELAYLDLDLAPDVVAYEQRRGHLLTRWIDGDVVAHAPLSPAEGATYLADLHNAVPLGIARYDYAAEVGAFFREARAAGGLDAEVEAVFNDLRWQPALRCGCHNDLNPWNIIRAIRARDGAENGPTVFRTLDWESAGDNDPLFDLAGLALGFDWSAEDALACLHAYCEQRRIRVAPSPEARLRAAMRAYRIREYAWAAAQIAAGTDRDEIREQEASMRRAVLDARHDSPG